MSAENLTEVVSVRFSATELAELRAAAAGRPVSHVVRERAAAAPESRIVYRKGDGWSVEAAAGRLITARSTGLRSAADARAFALALLEVADLPDLPDPEDEQVAS